jgi:hypothetical protein
VEWYVDQFIAHGFTTFDIIGIGGITGNGISR